MYFRSILDHIVNDRLDKAFEAFEFFFDDLADKRKEFLLYQSSFNALRNEEKLGKIGEEDLEIARKKSRQNLLELYSYVEGLMEEMPETDSGLKAGLNNKSAAVRKAVQEAVADKGYQIIKEIHSDQSSYYFKARRNSFVQKDYYVIQVLNWYRLHDSESGYNQQYLDFFSRCPHPFVDLIEFHPGNPSYIIRKYAEGIDMNILVQSGIKLSLVKALDVIVSISKGLLELKDIQLFYNNLIPDQIILDTSWDLHVLPLNIFEENENITTWKNLKDGIKFMSPEQLVLAGNKAEQNKLTLTSNQFSLALILFYIMEGEPLFEGKGLPSLYEDRINQKVTEAQLKTYFKNVLDKLLHLDIEEGKAKELHQEFKTIFETLLQYDPANRYERFDDFVSSLEFLKLSIEREVKATEDPNIYLVRDSLYRALVVNENLVESFYEQLKNQLPFKKSVEQEEEFRNIRLLYALDFLFGSVSNLNTPSYVKEGLACLVEHQHDDFSIEDYTLFFDLLKENVKTADSDWNDKIESAWHTFKEAVLDAIDTILKPV